MGGNIIEALKGPRLVEPPAWRRFIEQNGDIIITSIAVYKQPITRAFTEIFNFISLGKLNQAKQKYGYDDLVHVFMVVNNKIIIEKNQVLHIDFLSSEQISNLPNIPHMVIGGRNTTLAHFIQLGKNYAGAQNFIQYNIKTRNCQVFLQDLLMANGLYSEELREFLIQKAQEILDELPSIYSDVIKGATNLAGAIDVLLYGASRHSKTDFFY